MGETLNMNRGELEYMEREGIRAVSRGDAEYPGLLKEIHDPPPVLFVKGAFLPDDADSVAIVGSRDASAYGLRMAERLAFDLALAGITVVSGMARGIDSAAHKGAMKAGGRTIAVMGSGFRHIYPSESGKLVQEISAQGAVVTEFPSDVGPLKYNFPKRNRIISGLSKGVVVVEAAAKSGALITADFALEQGREVFAVPGMADSGMSGGSNRLIKDGAKLVTSAGDIMEEIKMTFPERAKDRGAGTQRVIPLNLSDEERVVADILEEEPGAHIDVLVERSGLGRKACEVLLRMEIKGIVTASAGKTYTFAGQR